MKRVINSRRSVIALVGLTMLFILALVNKVDVGPHIVGIVVAVAGANALQRRSQEPDK